jgi:uncharacterized protein YdaU (DUF1376 family)
MSLAYFPLFPTDFDADTGHLTFAEDGAYNRLLRLSWRCVEAKMPDDLDWICRKARATTPEDRALIEAVLAEFFTRKGGKVFSRRLHEEWVKANDAHAKRISAGSKGGRAKAMKTNDTDASNANAMLKQPEPEPEPYIEKKEIEPKGSPKKSDSVLVKDALTAVIEPDLADAFIAHRQKLKKPMTPYAAQLIAGKLRKAADPAACVQLSIVKGWQDVFPENVQAAGPKPAAAVADWWGGRDL